MYNTNRFVLQCVGILLGGCLTVKNYQGLITGEHEGYSLQVTPWSVSVVPEVLEDQEVPFEEVRMVPESPTATNGTVESDEVVLSDDVEDSISS